MMNKFLKRVISAGRTGRNYKRKEYLEAYREHTDYRVDKDRKDGIGGLWDEIGALQYQFLLAQGLQPGHRLLDYGCGTLRGGRFFIDYLEPGRYVGVDISRNVVAKAQELLRNENLADKKPELIWNANASLDFSEVGNQKFDFIIAQSVFTHLLPEHINTCIGNVARVMKSEGRFYFTNFDADEFIKRSVKDFAHPASFYRQLAGAYAFDLDDLSELYPHPRGQSMYVLTNKA